LWLGLDAYQSFALAFAYVEGTENGADEYFDNLTKILPAALVGEKLNSFG
jgi:hypothetical protein